MEASALRRLSPHVYCTNFPGIPLIDAEKFGEIIYLTDSFIDISKHEKVEELENRISLLLKDSIEEDYVLLIGFALVTAITTKLWFQRHSVMKILVHQQINKKYIEVVLRK